jgi:uncharacterized protein YdhG (YjbR/CyaY superfamily)
MRGVVATSVDDYLEKVEWAEGREALVKLRAILRDALPDAEEAISYGMPMYKQHGMVVGFAAFKGHCSLFPGATVCDFEDRLKEFKTSKGTIQFHPSKPLPEALVREIVAARVAENKAIAEEKKRK